MEQKHKIVIYTDGSCLNNPGKGGWSFVLMDETLGLVDEYIGCQEMSTNNQMEISAALIALEHILNDRCLSKNEIDEILIKSDSYQVINGSTTWLPNWIFRDWKTANNEPVKNQDLWKRMSDCLSQLHPKVKFEKVDGHSGEPFNERCDYLAKTASSSQCNDSSVLIKNMDLCKYKQFILDNFSSSVNIETSSTKGKKRTLFNDANETTMKKMKPDASTSAKVGKKKGGKKALCWICLIDGKIIEENDYKEFQKRCKGLKVKHKKKAMNEFERQQIIADFTAKASEEILNNSFNNEDDFESFYSSRGY